MPYRVRAVPRDQWPGRNRDGRHFPSAHWTVLEDDEATEAIREDPVLIVERITDAEAASTRAALLPEPGAPESASPEDTSAETESEVVAGNDAAGVTATAAPKGGGKTATASEKA